jgi:hypothetical protein
MGLFLRFPRIQATGLTVALEKLGAPVVAGASFLAEINVHLNVAREANECRGADKASTAFSRLAARA